MCEYKIRISAERPQKKGIQTLTEKEKGHAGCQKSRTGVCCGKHHKGQQK